MDMESASERIANPPLSRADSGAGRNANGRGLAGCVYTLATPLGMLPARI